MFRVFSRQLVSLHKPFPARRAVFLALWETFVRLTLWEGYKIIAPFMRSKGLGNLFREDTKMSFQAPHVFCVVPQMRIDNMNKGSSSSSSSSSSSRRTDGANMQEKLGSAFVCCCMVCSACLSMIWLTRVRRSFSLSVCNGLFNNWDFILWFSGLACMRNVVAFCMYILSAELPYLARRCRINCNENPVA